jgi:integrase
LLNLEIFSLNLNGLGGFNHHFIYKEQTMPVVQLKPSFIKTLAPLPGKTRTEWCDKNQPGLYVEARATSSIGTGTYYLRYKDSGGTTRHMRLGTTDTVSLVEARAEAKRQKAEIQLGADPSATARKQKEVPTLRAFVEDQYLPYIKNRNRSWKDDDNRLRQRILPAFGDQAMNTLTRKQLLDFHRSLKEGGLAGATCDHHLKLIRRIFNVAIEWNVVKDNPASKAQLFNEPNQLQQIPSPEALTRLLGVLATHERRTVCQVALYLLSTGARLSEALNASWEDIDSRTWRISAAISKSKRVRSVPLNDSALSVLNEIQPDPALRHGYLFVNPRTKDRLKTVHKAWSCIREAADLPHLRIHDLRHMYASFLVNSGHTLYEVQNILGHSTPLITQRYATLNTSALLSAASSASDRILAASPRPAPALQLVKTCS